MKSKVEVEVVARKKVVIVVEHDEGDDPCDLTVQDQENAWFAYQLGQDPVLDFENMVDLGEA